MKTTLLSCIFCLWFFTANGQLPSGYSEKIDSLFQNINSGMPGYAVAVIKGGEVIYKKGFGMADVEGGKPITSTTSFDMASISKQFTAMCILLLEEQGKLSVQDDIRKYFPQLPDYGKAIKIKHLLSHMSGIKEELTTLAGMESEDVNAESLLKLLAAQKTLNFLPGNEMMYSNTGYDLLGIIVEKVSGIPLKNYAHEHIFKPLGMNNTQFSEKYEGVENSNKAYGYENSLNEKYIRTSTESQD